jgi:glucose uptake protein
MFTPSSLSIALLMMITSAVCWGSWANTYKGVKGYRFELFYWDYAIGIFLVSLVLAFTMGSTGNNSSSFLSNVHAADTSNIVNALIGGALFNLANLLLVAAIDMAGLAVAFPISIGIALVVGTVLSYILQPRGNVVFLVGGVACALIAVILDGKAYGRLISAGRSVSRKSVVTCIVSGVLMGLWSPFTTYGTTRGNALTPYSSVVFLTLGALLSCFIWNLYFMKKPLAGETGQLQRIFQRGSLGTSTGIAGRGHLGHWNGVQSWLRASSTSFAISYAIGQSAPMVAALWGVLAWKEFAELGFSKVYLALMFAFYGLAILLVARAS